MSVTQVLQTVDLPGYRILRSLGEGGMASVFLAMQESLDREVALKVMAPALAENSEFTDRFLKEGRLAAKLSHPNLVTVYDIGQHNGLYYLAQEFIPGGTLRERMGKAMSVPETLDVMRDVALGLAYAHEKGVVHRDVKPANVLFRANGTAVLADFGIAKAMNSNTMATLAGNSIGTPHYMSPEQARAEKVDGRSDLYSLGTMMYELLTGAPPYDSSDPYTIALMHVTHPIPKLPAPHAWLQPLLDRLMAKLPDQRFATGDEFVIASEKLIATAPEAKAMRESMATRKRTATRAAVRPTDDAEPTQRGVAIAQGIHAGVSPSRPKPWLWAASGAVALVLAVVAWSMFGRKPADVAEIRTADTPVVVADPTDSPQGSDAPVIPDAPPPIPIEGDVGKLLTRANEYVRAAIVPTDETRMLGRKLASPPGDNAIELYQQVLRLDPGNSEAGEGLQRIADLLADRAQHALDRGAKTGCAFLVEDGLRAVPGHSGLVAMQQKGCRLE
ncbi:MAG TPA: serine/threonine-protein kinase [Patescibacteria group bacterium]|nr:serine/threonine-protein kinase [Patescibacteria group bacterium]